MPILFSELRTLIDGQPERAAARLAAERARAAQHVRQEIAARAMASRLSAGRDALDFIVRLGDAMSKGRVRRIAPAGAASVEFVFASEAELGAAMALMAALRVMTAEHCRAA